MDTTTTADAAQLFTVITRSLAQERALIVRIPGTELDPLVESKIDELVGLGMLTPAQAERLRDALLHGKIPGPGEPFPIIDRDASVDRLLVAALRQGAAVQVDGPDLDLATRRRGLQLLNAATLGHALGGDAGAALAVGIANVVL